MSKLGIRCACDSWCRDYGGRPGEEHHRNCRHWCERVGDAYVSKTELIVLGDPAEDDETHNCDAMGCGTFSHVMYRMPLRANPEENRAGAVRAGEVQMQQEKLDQRIAALAVAHSCDEFDDGSYLCYTFQFPGLRKFVEEAARLNIAAIPPSDEPLRIAGDGGTPTGKEIADSLSEQELHGIRLDIAHQLGGWTFVGDREIFLAGAKWMKDKLAATGIAGDAGRMGEATPFPPGWKFERVKKGPFDYIHGFLHRDGRSFSVVLDKLSRNPVNVFYMLADDMLKAQEAASVSGEAGEATNGVTEYVPTPDPDPERAARGYVRMVPAAGVQAYDAARPWQAHQHSPGHWSVARGVPLGQAMEYMRGTGNLTAAEAKRIAASANGVLLVDGPTVCHAPNAISGKAG